MRALAARWQSRFRTSHGETRAGTHLLGSTTLARYCSLTHSRIGSTCDETVFRRLGRWRTGNRVQETAVTGGRG